jgi:capsular polysaccharide biosynthesis protein
VLPSRSLSLGDYWFIVLRRKWLLIIPAVLISCGVALWCVSLPNIYRASTVILVEGQKVPDTYVRSTVSSPMQERLRTITQQIMSQTRLEQVIRDLRLLDGPQDKQAVETYITKMRRRIGIEVKGSDAFTVSYEEQDPHTAMLVANTLAALFIEENVKVREQRAIDTTDFLAKELQRVGTLLEQQERTVGDFKRRYTEELPGRQEINRQTLEQLRKQRQTNLDAIEQVRNKKTVLGQRLSTLKTDDRNWRNCNRSSPINTRISSAYNARLPNSKRVWQRRALSHLPISLCNRHPGLFWAACVGDYRKRCGGFRRRSTSKYVSSTLRSKNCCASRSPYRNGWPSTSKKSPTGPCVSRN